MSDDLMPVEALSTLIESWTVDNANALPVFVALRDHLQGLAETTLTVRARPGVSWSLRGTRNGSARPLFVLVDVIDDDPEGRWLSVCFYDALLTDPEELGDMVPGGLMGENARCFDVDDPEDGEALAAYLCARISEAWGNSL